VGFLQVHTSVSLSLLIPPAALHSLIIPSSTLSIYLSICLSVYLPTHLPIYLWLYSPLLCLGRFFSFLIFSTVSKISWTGNQPVARPLPAHRTAETHNKRKQIPMPQMGFEPTIPVFEHAKIRPRGHCDRHHQRYVVLIFTAPLNNQLKTIAIRPFFSWRKRSWQHAVIFQLSGSGTGIFATFRCERASHCINIVILC
jgi:hypothetical protein